MRAAIALCALACVLAGAPDAHAQLFGRQGLDPVYCQQPTVRQTVVYVDDMMSLHRADWAQKLAAKLRATLTPGESVAVVQLSPEAGSSSEIWAGCWPNLGAAARAKAAGETYLFSKNPLDQIADQQKFFIRDLGLALTRIADDSKPAAEAASLDGHPRKQLLRALASDGGRFANTEKTLRAIVYSDLAENSDLGSVFKPLDPEHPDYGDKLGTYLRHGVFYDYGLAAGLGAADGLPERIRAFWTAALTSMSAVAAGMGSDLNVPNVLPVRSVTEPVEVQMKDEALSGRLSLLADSDGTLVDSWLGVSRLSIVGLSGSYQCSAATPPVCKLSAMTSAGLVTSARIEQLSMTGSSGASLAGQIGVKGTSYLYPIKSASE